MNTASAVRSIEYRLDETDRRIIHATQAGLPVCARPYDRVADELELDVGEVMSRMRAMQEAGVIRRIAAVPNHYQLGFRANGMSVWDVDDDRIVELGPRVGELECVSHCYRRPRRPPVWPYNLFAMVHGRTRAEVGQGVETIAAMLGDACRGHDVLFSSHILKKTGLRLSQSGS
ncbi:MAG: AsnC family transcriptional regulator [Gammaproteobacteria bacterium]|nr:AsnC family transcriptional regulator [Gammaproteobacteria bacterium]